MTFVFCHLLQISEVVKLLPFVSNVICSGHHRLYYIEHRFSVTVDGIQAGIEYTFKKVFLEDVIFVQPGC